MSTLEAHDDVGLLRKPIDDLALPLVPPLGTNHDHIGHEAFFLRVAEARIAFKLHASYSSVGPGRSPGLITAHAKLVESTQFSPGEAVVIRPVLTTASHQAR